MIQYNETWGWLINFLSFFLPPGKRGAALRGKLYKPFLKRCGKNFCIPQHAYIYNPNNLVVGDNVWLGYNSYIGEGEVEIRNNVIIGPFTTITASNHNRKNGSFRFTGFTAKKIIIKENVWIGAHACILSGITIGKGSLVAAGAVVTKDVDDASIVGGVPAIKIKEFLDER